MKTHTLIGVDLGGTKVQVAKIQDREIRQTHRRLISSRGSEKQVVEEVIESISEVFDPTVSGIGIGVPSVVDVEKGVVYDVQNIPSWKEVSLKQILEERFGVPIYVNNDANCFAAGEKYFGKGESHSNLLGLILGTGMAAGIIIKNQLYEGHNCGAGEFGMLPYLDFNYEYYCSGQFFTNLHNTSGKILFEQAQMGDVKALKIFQEYGYHLGNGIIAILYALDPPLIILGGSVSKAYPFFKKALWERLQVFAYRPVVKRLSIELSENPNIAVLGAAALVYIKSRTDL